MQELDDPVVLAFIAETIRRAVGVDVGDEHLAVGLAMCDQLRRVRLPRATKIIKSGNKLLRTRRDRSLATAFPVMYESKFVGINVCVIVTHETYAREDAQLYHALVQELDDPIEVKANDEWLRRAPAGEAWPRITVATPEVLAQVEGHRALLIARGDPREAKRLGRAMPGTAMLPDL